MLKRKIKIFIFIGVILSIFNGINIVQAKDKQKNTYVKDGMVFVVGKHKPDERIKSKDKVNKRINPKKATTSNISEQDISDNEKMVENIDNEDSLEKITEKDVTEKEGLIYVFIGAIRGLWEKITSLGERMDKQDDNINNLVETATSTTDELTDHNKRLEKLEETVFKDGANQSDGNKEK